MSFPCSVLRTEAPGTRRPKWNKRHRRQTRSPLSPGHHSMMCTAVARSTNQAQALMWAMISNPLKQLVLSGAQRCCFAISKHDSTAYGLIFPSGTKVRNPPIIWESQEQFFFRKTKTQEMKAEVDLIQNPLSVIISFRLPHFPFGIK